MKIYLFSIMLAAMLILPAASYCFAGDGWQANLAISAGKASSKLTFGQNPAATDLEDGFYDVPAMLSGEFRAAFTDGDTALWRDIRAIGNGTGKEWHLTIISGTDETINVRWNQQGFPEESRVELYDVDSGESIDMKLFTSYVLTDRNDAELIIKISDI